MCGHCNTAILWFPCVNIVTLRVLWPVSVLWLPLRAYTFLVRSGGSLVAGSPLSEASLLLVLVLLHHAPSADSLRRNAFRDAFAHMQVGCQPCPAS